jgi:glycosyltransferase involved in cell wall biosynthesis
MKILHLSYSDLGGGAARGAYQQHKALQAVGIDSKMLVLQKLSTDRSVLAPSDKTTDILLSSIRPIIDRTLVTSYLRQKKYIFSPAISPLFELKKIHEINPDVINLHWINKGFMRIESLKNLKKPLVWTLRDMWSMTGGCHYTEGCDRFQNQCGACPQLESNKERDLSRQIWTRKQRSWQDLNLHLVAVSHWIKDCVSKSSLLHQYPIEVIPSTIDTNIFLPRDKSIARDFLSLDRNKYYLLFTTLDPKDKRKGLNLLLKALPYLSNFNLKQEVEILVLGTDTFEPSQFINIPVRCLGKLSDDLSLSLVYNAADVTIVPSIQDACPKTGLESLACGIPVVSFDSTGLRDIVEHRVNGYRAQCFDPQDLAQGLQWVLEHENPEELSINARKTVEERFLSSTQAMRYIDLYHRVLNS